MQIAIPPPLSLRLEVGVSLRYLDEYYKDGSIHASYPDFILKDYKGRIHLFESKSINGSSSFDIDQKDYEEKIEALKECYKYASKLTGYDFYIPIKSQSDWKIWYMHNGEEPRIISKEKLVDIIQV